MNCSHEKVYEKYILTSNPPKINWECFKCEEKGTDIFKAIENKLTYTGIIEDVCE
jgi:hypothetical protein